MTDSPIHDRLAAAERGENPTVICRMRSGWLVMCDRQTPRGWCILIATPTVHDLDDLDADRRAAFLGDMATAGAAVKRATGAYRMNYSILGNTEPVLHAHLQPRSADEPDERRRRPLWRYEEAYVPFDAGRDAGLMAAIRGSIGTT